jgi:hypothetical protein
VNVRGVSGSVAASLALSACAVPTHYAGMDLRAGAASAEVQALAQRARSGDKQTQLDLGFDDEEGRGMSQDSKRAHTLFRMFATQDGEMIYVYVPATRKGDRGDVTPVNMELVVSGLAEARERLSSLKVRALGIGNGA